jgi:hypothetical protein
VPRHREGIGRDEASFIPLYRSTLDSLLAGVPGRAGLMRVVDRAVDHDHGRTPTSWRPSTCWIPPQAGPRR